MLCLAVYARAPQCWTTRIAVLPRQRPRPSRLLALSKSERRPRRAAVADEERAGRLRRVLLVADGRRAAQRRRGGAPSLRRPLHVAAPLRGRGLRRVARRALDGVAEDGRAEEPPPAMASAASRVAALVVRVRVRVGEQGVEPRREARREPRWRAARQAPDVAVRARRDAEACRREDDVAAMDERGGVAIPGVRGGVLDGRTAMRVVVHRRRNLEL